MSTYGSSFDLSTVSETDGFRIGGEAQLDYVGLIVSPAGDINRDGFDDIVVASSSANRTGQNNGISYVLFGTADGLPSDFSLGSINGTNGFMLIGEMEYDFLGDFASSVGDINGDSFVDLALSAPGRGGNDHPGCIYVIFGKSGPISAEMDLSALDGLEGFKINAETPRDGLGRTTALGDVNGDGLDDFAIEAPEASPNGKENAGAVYVVYGKEGVYNSTLNVTDLNGEAGFKISGAAANDLMGNASTAGDVNGDGIQDILVTSFSADLNRRVDSGAV